MKPQEYKPLHDINALIKARKYDDLNKACDENLDHMVAIDKAAKEAGQLLFRTFSLHVADGLACYQITKVNHASTLASATVQIKHLDGVCDNYYDNVLGSGGTFPLTLITNLLD